MSPEVERIVVWMEEGCPCYLYEGDAMSRRLGDARIAARCLREGLADLDFEHCMPPVDPIVRAAQIVRGFTNGPRDQ